jgi:predicted transposase/invertase (TIGR01784 family)
MAEGKAVGLAEGKAEGRAEGRAEGLSEVAKAMKAKGIDVNIIAEVTGITVDDVLRL